MEHSNVPDHEGLQVDLRRQEEASVHTLTYGQEPREAFQPQEPAPAYVPNQKVTPSVDQKVDVWAPKRDSVSSSEKQFLPAVARAPGVSLLQSRKKLWMWLAAVAIIAAIIAIVVPVGVIVSRQNQQLSSSSSGQSTTSSSDNSASQVDLSPRLFSNKGAFNGTDIAAAPSQLDSNDRMWVFWQDYTGDIKVSTLSMDGDWQPGESLGITNAANGTALAALTHLAPPSGTTVINHLVYVTDDLFLADVILVDGNGPWRDGGLYRLRMPAPGTPSPSTPSRLSFLQKPNAISYLYTSGSLGNLNEHKYNHTLRAWDLPSRHIFPETNGFGGVAPQTSKDGKLTTLYTIDKNAELRIHWRSTVNGDCNTCWNIGDNAPANLWPNSSVTAPVQGDDTDIVYYLGQSREVMARRVSGSKAAARWMEETNLGISTLPGTQMFAIASKKGGDPGFETHLFFQRSGDDLQHYVGNGVDFTEVGTIPLT